LRKTITKAQNEKREKKRSESMIFSKVRENWKKRARRLLIKRAGKEDWCAFAKALCRSWDSCQGFPYDCKGCFDSYFNPKEILQRIIEK
jgi:hypothetical protein